MVIVSTYLYWLMIRSVRILVHKWTLWKFWGIGCSLCLVVVLSILKDQVCENSDI